MATIAPYRRGRSPTQRGGEEMEMPYMNANFYEWPGKVRIPRVSDKSYWM